MNAPVLESEYSKMSIVIIAARYDDVDKGSHGGVFVAVFSQGCKASKYEASESSSYVLTSCTPGCKVPLKFRGRAAACSLYYTIKQ